VLAHALGIVAFGASRQSAPDLQESVRAARASLRADRVDLAMRQASALRSANPTDAAVQSLLGDIAYRKADFDTAESCYRAAISADRGCARAMWGLGRIEELNFRRGAARDYFATAFRLDHRDPQIIQSYGSVVPNRDVQTILLKNYIALGSDASEDLDSALGRIQLHQQLGAREIGILASPYRSYALPMTPYYPASARPAGMLLKVSINGGNPLRLIFDTGAGGVLIRSKAAEKLGLEFLSASLVRGLGASEPAKARVALAQYLKIDDLSLRNCLIEVSDSVPAGDADGIIGAILFQRFLVRFNPGEKLLELLPFPSGEVGSFTPEWPWIGRDRVVAAGMERFKPVRHLGHLLLVRAGVNTKRFGHFILDTGAAFSSLSYDVAGRQGIPLGTTPIYGLSGRINDATHISPVQFHFAQEPMVDGDAIALDLREVSRREGVEISGLIGYSVLSRGILTINYRDGLIDIADRK
jgi:tetratricopeptide (TPR) repeat protein